jgi:hypothetical protein
MLTVNEKLDTYKQKFRAHIKEMRGKMQIVETVQKNQTTTCTSNINGKREELQPGRGNLRLL